MAADWLVGAHGRWLVYPSRLQRMTRHPAPPPAPQVAVDANAAVRAIGFAPLAFVRSNPAATVPLPSVHDTLYRRARRAVEFGVTGWPNSCAAASGTPCREREKPPA